MSIIVDGNLIKISKPNGQEMFNSTNKLVHKKYSTTGAVSIGGATSLVEVPLPATTYDPEKDFSLIFVTFTAANGTITSQLVNSTVQLNFTLPMSIVPNAEFIRYDAYDMLAVGVMLEGLIPVLRFTTYGHTLVGSTATNAEPETFMTMAQFKNSVSTVSFNWKFVQLTYQ